MQAHAQHAQHARHALISHCTAQKLSWSLQTSKPSENKLPPNSTPALPPPGTQQAAYVFVYPNLMINSYGPWIDTNLVLPTGPDSCKVQHRWNARASAPLAGLSGHAPRALGCL